MQVLSDSLARMQKERKGIFILKFFHNIFTDACLLCLFISFSDPIRTWCSVCGGGLPLKPAAVCSVGESLVFHTDTVDPQEIPSVSINGSGIFISFCESHWEFLSTLLRLLLV